MFSVALKLFNKVKKQLSVVLPILISPTSRFLHNIREVNVCANMGNVDKAKDILFNASKRFIYSSNLISNTHKNILSNALMDKYSRNGIRSYAKKSVADIAELIADDLVTKNDTWKPFYHLFLRNGFFTSAHLIRNKALESAMAWHEGFHSERKRKALQALIEQNDIIKINNHLSAIKEKGSAEYQSLEQNWHLLSGYSGALALRLKETKADKSFADYIAGKRVAVVGPAPSSALNGEEIDSFDIVVRVSHLKPIDPTHRPEVGSKTNISYYGNVFTKQIDSKIHDFGFADNLHFLVFKSSIHGSRFQSFARSSGRVRYFNGPRVLFFNGSPMMIQNILFDLLHYKPASIKLFKTTFYLSPKPHLQGYHDIWDYPKNDSFKDIQGFAHHDIVSNFMFVKNLFENKRIEADEACQNVLRLSKEEFVEALESIHSV